MNLVEITAGEASLLPAFNPLGPRDQVAFIGGGKRFFKTNAAVPGDKLVSQCINLDGTISLTIPKGFDWVDGKPGLLVPDVPDVVSAA